eukprot:2784073-Rhodomonas_salina.3
MPADRSSELEKESARDGEIPSEPAERRQSRATASCCASPDQTPATHMHISSLSTSNIEPRASICATHRLSLHIMHITPHSHHASNCVSRWEGRRVQLGIDGWREGDGEREREGG